jgi:hypothetical protein
MSGLSGIALLIIATQALRVGLASANVVMQPDGPVDVTKGPTIAVFIERAGLHAKDVSLAMGDSQVVLRVELFAPVAAESSGGAAALKGSTALFFMWRQCVAALAPDASPWGALWERFRLAVDAEMFAPPLFETEKGVKVAAHVYSLTVDALSEPPFGAPTAAWSALLAQMRTQGGELTGFADLLETALTGALSEWPALAATLGVSSDTLAAIGLGDTPAPVAPLPPAEQADSQTVAVPDALAAPVETIPAGPVYP